jgi:hypothetical protein
MTTMKSEERLKAAKAIIRELLDLGCTISCYYALLVRVGGVEEIGEGCLLICPASRLTPELRARVEEYRSELLCIVGDAPVWGLKSGRSR